MFFWSIAPGCRHSFSPYQELRVSIKQLPILRLEAAGERLAALTTLLRFLTFLKISSQSFERSGTVVVAGKTRLRAL